MSHDRRIAGRFARVDRLLQNEGYEPRPPSTEVAVQDEGTCVRLVCRRCGTPGLAYRPYVRPRRFGYRAIAVCGRCDDAVEF